MLEQLHELGIRSVDELPCIHVQKFQTQWQRIDCLCLITSAQASGQHGAKHNVISSAASSHHQRPRHMKQCRHSDVQLSCHRSSTLRQCSIHSLLRLQEL